MSTEAAYSTNYARSRGRIQNGTGLGIAYPHPFFDLSSTYTPSSIQGLFRQLREFFLLNGLFHTIIHKLSEYPLTDLLFDDKDLQTAGMWKTFFERTLQFRRFQVEVGLDYYAYGNALVSVRYPLIKWLICKSCGRTHQASTSRSRWAYRGNRFHLSCTCGAEGEAKVRDQTIKQANEMQLIRLDPELVQIDFNPLTRKRTYYLRIPAGIRSDVMLGRKHVVESLPQAYLQAVELNEMVVVPDDEIFHMARPSVSGFDPGWGCPLLLPVLKEAFQLQVMRKAQETVLLEHLIPLRILFPQAASGTSDPFAMVPLPQWKESMAKEIARWRWDPAYMPIVPLPLGQQSLGGDGKALMVQPEMQALIDHIVVSLGVPREFIFGGAAWSGSNVSLRTVENMFFGFISLQLDLVRFVQRKASALLNWPISEAKFRPFRMADDIQRKQFLLQAAQGEFISQTSFLEEMDMDATREAERRIQETTTQVEAMRIKQVALARMQAEVNEINTKAQLKLQELQQQAAMAQQQQQAAMQQQQVEQQQAALLQKQQVATQLPPADAFNMAFSSRMGQQAPGVPAQAVAQTAAQQIAALPQNQQAAALQNLAAQLGPEVAQLVQQLMGGAIADGTKLTGGPDAPDPEQKPPRRPRS